MFVLKLFSSAEEHQFYVAKDVAMVSGTISHMLDGGFRESSGTIRFPEMNTLVLEKVVQYLYYKKKHENAGRDWDPFTQTRIQRFDRQSHVADLGSTHSHPVTRKASQVPIAIRTFAYDARLRFIHCHSSQCS